MAFSRNPLGHRLGWHAFLAGLLVACVPAASAPTSVTTAPTALPDTSVQDASGQPTTLRRWGSGKVMVIDLWATWCDACRDTTARVERLAASGHGDDLVTVGLDVGEDPAVAKRFLASRPSKLDILFDPEFHFSDALGIDEVPMVLVVDRQGNIVQRGKTLDAPMLAKVKTLLEEQP